MLALNDPADKTSPKQKHRPAYGPVSSGGEPPAGMLAEVPHDAAGVRGQGPCVCEFVNRDFPSEQPARIWDAIPIRASDRIALTTKTSVDGVAVLASEYLEASQWPISGSRAG